MCTAVFCWRGSHTLCQYLFAIDPKLRCVSFCLLIPNTTGDQLTRYPSPVSPRPPQTEVVTRLQLNATSNPDTWILYTLMQDAFVDSNGAYEIRDVYVRRCPL